MKTIPLSQGLFSTVDDEDFNELNQYKWSARKDYNTYYATRHIKKEDGTRTTTKMHQEIVGKKAGYVIDHQDGNGLNNQRNNLRHVTSRQNSQNLHIPKSSQYPGVIWRKDVGKWRALIRINGRIKHLGYFKNEHEAYLAYCNANKNFLNQEVI